MKGTGRSIGDQPAEQEHHRRVPNTSALEGRQRRTQPRWCLCARVLGLIPAQHGTVRSLMSKDLAGVRGKELSMITVEYAPRGCDSERRHIRRHRSVLEGSIVMQVSGGAPVTLRPLATRSHFNGLSPCLNPSRFVLLKSLSPKRGHHK